MNPHPTHTPARVLHRSPKTVAAMWGAIAASAALLLVLLDRGWGERAWSIAAGVLLVSCLAVCVWATVIGHRSSREVERVIAQLAQTRRQATEDRTP